MKICQTDLRNVSHHCVKNTRKMLMDSYRLYKVESSFLLETSGTRGKENDKVCMMFMRCAHE